MLQYTKEKLIFYQGEYLAIAGKQLGKQDERDLFPEALRMIKQCKPKAFMLENVRGILASKFVQYRLTLLKRLKLMGYTCDWKLLNSSDYGVSQLRPRAILVGFIDDLINHFTWPTKKEHQSIPVGELLYEEMASLGWERAKDWKKQANTIAPTLVGGSKKHGGADLGPSRARAAWLELGLNGGGLAETPPINGFEGNPKLTLKMTALVQGFPKDWNFVGKKTPAYRQVGNAFPPPVAEAMGKSIIKALKNGEK